MEKIFRGLRGAQAGAMAPVAPVASSPTKRYKIAHLGASVAWCTVMELAYRRGRLNAGKVPSAPRNDLGWRLPRGRLLDLETLNPSVPPPLLDCAPECLTYQIKLPDGTFTCMITSYEAESLCCISSSVQLRVHFFTLNPHGFPLPFGLCNGQLVSYR